MTREAGQPIWFPKPWLYQQQIKKAGNKPKDTGWSQKKSENTQGLYQDRDIILQLNEQSYEEEKKEKGGKKSKGTYDINNG